MKRYANEQLKKFMKENQVSYFDLAEKLGLGGDYTVYRKLRKEVDENTKNQYMKAVKEIIKERGE